ncbi:Uncharacterized protein HZ326_21700 [Fusarium oxysporum f. sp. albedinis]|nr:Uncharacterized protein HZ326_21700 [Fusarium oxysporum f. sp. albedinis]
MFHGVLFHPVNGQEAESPNVSFWRCFLEINGKARKRVIPDRGSLDNRLYDGWTTWESVTGGFTSSLHFLHSSLMLIKSVTDSSSFSIIDEGFVRLCSTDESCSISHNVPSWRARANRKTWVNDKATHCNFNPLMLWQASNHSCRVESEKGPEIFEKKKQTPQGSVVVLRKWRCCRLLGGSIYWERGCSTIVVQTIIFNIIIIIIIMRWGQYDQKATLQTPHRKVSAGHSDAVFHSRRQRLAHRHFPLKQGRLLARVIADALYYYGVLAFSWSSLKSRVERVTDIRKPRFMLVRGLVAIELF